MSKGKTVGKIIAYVLVLLVVVGVIGVIVRFTGGFTSDFKTFYVTVDGKDVLTTASGYKLTTTQPLTVDVKYTFGSAGGDASGYSVKIVPNVIENEDFDFTLNGDVYSYQAETDLTAGFEIERGETSFTLTPKGGLTEILQAVYPNYEVGDCRENSYENMYALIVTSYNNDNIIVTPETNPAMMMSVLRAGDNTENVIQPSGDTDGISITATIGPETAENKEIQWTVKWKESTGGNHSGGTIKAIDWSEGKNVTDYVVLSEETSMSGESITITCKQDFGEQIIVTATSAGTPEISASCTVDYCQKIKSLDYTFKYGGNAMTAPAVDSDGVYRVDYTGEEKSYTVECVPVYTNYTVDDEFVKNVSGQFANAFGYTSDKPFTQISLQAGLFGCVNEPALSEAAESFISDIELLAGSAGWQIGNSVLEKATTTYNGLTEAEKTHSKIINRYQAMQKFIGKCGNGELFYAAKAEAQAVISVYTASSPSGSFNGEAAIESVDALLTAAKTCNDAGTGILEYTITYTGVYSEKTFTFKLGYTASSVSAAKTMNISLPSVMF